MGRPLDWSPLHEPCDPIPGDPEVVAAAGRHYCRVAQAIHGASTKLRKIAGNEDMRSSAVDALRATIEEVADNIDRAFERYDGVGQSLSGYWPHLDDAQEMSLRALQKARQAQEQLADAQHLMAAAQGQIDAAPPGADTTVAQGAWRRAEGTADEVHGLQNAAMGLLGEARDVRDAAARRARGGVNEVKDTGDLNESFWDNYGVKIVKVITKIADAVALVAGILAMVAVFIPVIGPFLAGILEAVALIASLVSLIGHTVLAATGEEGWSEVALAALGVVTFGLGRAAARGLRAGVKGVRGASRVSAGSWAARSPAARAAAGLDDSADSMAAIRGMTGEAMPRRAAIRAIRNSDEFGAARFGREFVRSYRDVPGKFAEDESSLRQADMGDVSRQLSEAVTQGRHSAGSGKSAVLRALGHGDAARELEGLGAINPVIRNSENVMSHMNKVNRYSNGLIANTVSGYGQTGYSGYKEVASAAETSPAENLNLDDSGQLRPEKVGLRR